MKKIKLFRLLRGMTQLDLQDRSGVAASRISLIECGYVTLSSRDMKRLAKALGVSPEDIQSEVKLSNGKTGRLLASVGS